MTGLNVAAMTVAATALKGAMLYAQIHSGPAGSAGTANIGATTRKSVTWGSVTGPGNFGISSAVNFTGGTANGPAYSVTLWSASTSGTYYGEFLLSGDATFDSSGNYTLSALDLVGGNASTAASPPVAAFDSLGAGANGNTTSWSWSHTIGTGATALIVMTSTFANPEPTITVTCGSTPVPLIGAKYNYYFDGYVYCAVRVFGLLSPPTGAQTISVSATSSAILGGNSVAYSNVSSFGTAVTGSSTGNKPTVTIPSSPGQIAVGAFGAYHTSFTKPTGTSRFNVPYTAWTEPSHIYQDTSVPDQKTETTLSTDPVGGDAWGAVGVPLIP